MIGFFCFSDESKLRENKKKNRLRNRAKKASDEGSRKRSDQRAQVSIAEPEEHRDSPAENVDTTGANRPSMERQTDIGDGGRVVVNSSAGGVGEGEVSNAEFEVIGPCVLCSDNELEQAYCKATGRRQEVRRAVRYTNAC